MQLNQQDIQGLDKEYRRAFINSLAGFRQAALCKTIISQRAIPKKITLYNNIKHYTSLQS